MANVERFVLVGVLLIVGAGSAETMGADAADERPEASQASLGDAYALPACPVTGNPLGAKPVIKKYDGRELRFCCDDCIAKFGADKASNLSRIDTALVALQSDVYPLKDCPVTGATLRGSMGKPVEYIYRNRLVRLCCQGCVSELEKNPGKYLALLDAAVIEKQKPAYPLDTCLVSGDKLGGSMGAPVDYVVANRLVRFCCKACIKQFEGDPPKYLSKLAAARRGKAGVPAGSEK